MNHSADECLDEQSAASSELIAESGADRLSEVSALEPQLQSEGPAEASEMLGTAALLLRCLEQIAAPQRRCLVLAYQEGLTHSEIARAVNEPLGTVKSWVRRSLLALRRCLES